MTVEAPEIAVEGGGHVVHFYDDDAVLAATVGSYLADAITDTGAAVVIATEDHLGAFERRLAAAGVDVAEAKRAGTLVTLDAALALSRFSHDGRIDAGAFDRTIAEVVRQMVGDGRRVHAYGEMVALLWDAGHVLAAIELERLWNTLGDDLSFSLLCAYRQASVADPDTADSVQHICSLHTQVVRAPQERARDFSAGPEAPRAARRFVAEALRQWGHGDELVQDAQLVISELATNSVVHAGSSFSVLIRGEDAGVRISVADRNPTQPELRHPPLEQPAGRGLQVVSAITSRWGVDAAADGKTVWAHLEA